MQNRPNFFPHQTSGSISSEVPTSVARQSDPLHRHIIVRGDRRLTQRLLADAEERRRSPEQGMPKNAESEVGEFDVPKNM